MANPAVFSQLPIMVRKSVWPSLNKNGLILKDVPGDGNCLFAALADQLFTDATRHPEIRKVVVEYMRAHREDFEYYAIIEDIQRRRTTRGQIAAAKTENVGDIYEQYLATMSASRTYGGQCELVAFCRAYDRDVVIHRPQGQYENENRTVNDRRTPGAPVITVQVAYGDEVNKAHYDSVRQGDVQRNKQKQRPQHKTNLPPRKALGRAEQIEAVRRARPDFGPGDIENFLEQTKTDIDVNFQQLVDRGRSSSASSSQRSSSSKRSLGPDKEPHRATKRADRRKSLKKRAVAVISSSVEQGTEVSFRIRLDSQEPSTPTSTQDTEYSSDPAEATGGVSVKDEYHVVKNPEETSDSDASLNRMLKGLTGESSLRTDAAKSAGSLKHRSV